MWQCEEDIMKDLSLLNDFGTPGDTEPYKVLYSNGRGSGVLQKKDHQMFICPRSGEAIQFDDCEKNKTSFRGKGRGSSFARSLKSNYQLQKQLRLARPMGSGDEAIESYYRRNRPAQSSDDTASALQSTSEVNVPETDTTIRDPVCQSKPVERIKGIRSSSLMSNALISSLLSKSESCSQPKVKKMPTEEESNSTNGEIFEAVSSEDETSIGVKNDTPDKARGDINEIEVCHNSSQKEFDFDNNSSKNDSDNNNDLSVNLKGVKCLNVDEESSSSKDSRNEVNHSLITSNKADSNIDQYSKQGVDRNEIYRRLGEKLNNARKKITDSSNEASFYDFNPVYKYISSFPDYTDEKLVECFNSTTTTFEFQFSSDDFPALKKTTTNTNTNNQKHE